MSFADGGASGPAYDLLIRGGTVYDGSGGAPFDADIGVVADRIAAIGPLADARAAMVLDASGLAVAPGFINMLSHSYISILHDGRSLSELTQGVTTQVFGEGHSMGPLNHAQLQHLQDVDEGLTYEAAWTSLAGYLAYAERKGISQNVASYIGATTLREYVAGHENRPLTAREMDTVCGLIRQEMAAGALGIGSSLIYPPAFFASTDELTAMCAAAAPYAGKYISHMRNEGPELLHGIDELLQIARGSGVPAEIYHLKAMGRDAWPLMQPAIERIETARAAGLAITADMYPYTAGGVALWSFIPPWFHADGPEPFFQRLTDPVARREMRQAIEGSGEGWQNLYRATGSAENIMILQLRNPELRQLQGKTLAALAALAGTDPIEALLDLVLHDRSPVSVAYFMMSEENVRLGLQQPWVSLGSDAASIAAEGVFLTRSTHPRAYGTFARLLGRYVREERLLSLAEAVRRLTSLPAANLGLDHRGRIAWGFFADLAVFDPETIIDHATFEQPHQYASGLRHVVVNGQPALRDGVSTGILPGRALFGPGRRR